MEFNRRVAERAEDERTQTTITQKQICDYSQVTIMRQISRLCELCVSAVNIRSGIINTQGIYGIKPQRRRAYRGLYYYQLDTTWDH